MKFLNFACLLLLLCSLQPKDKRYQDCSGRILFYNKSKLVKQQTTYGCNIFGAGIASAPFLFGGKKITTDSIVFKID